VPHPSCSHPPDPLRPGELVEVLAERLLEAHLAGDVPGAALVRARLTADGVDLAVWPVGPGDHPLAVLAGTEVGRRWSVSGLVTAASARPAGHPAGGASDRPVALAVLADRSGHVAHRVAGPGGPGPAAPGPPEGRLIDGLLRSLGRPTPPPAGPPGPWWATLWLDRVVAEVASEPAPRRTLLGLAELHPLVGAGLTPRDVTLLHRIAPRPSVAGWEVMRRALAEPGDPASPPERALRRALLPLVAPEVARWCDHGSFARWLEQALPSRAVLLAATDALLAPRLAGALRRAVGAPTIPDHR